LHYFAKNIVIIKKNMMPRKVDKSLQNSATQGILEQEKFMIKILFICHGRSFSFAQISLFYADFLTIGECITTILQLLKNVPI